MTAPETNSITKGVINKISVEGGGIYSLPGSDAANYVTEEKDAGIWHYRVWSNGFKECWGKYHVENVNLQTSWGNSYNSDSYTYPKYPVSFSAYPIRLWQVFSPSNGYPPRVMCDTQDLTYPGMFVLNKEKSGTISSCDVLCYAAGF